MPRLENWSILNNKSFFALSCDGLAPSGINHYDIESDWQPVLQEVTCEHALKAWLIKNRKIKCVLPDDKVNEYIRKEVVITPSNNDLVHFRTYAKYGKWYILED